MEKQDFLVAYNKKQMGDSVKYKYYYDCKVFFEDDIEPSIEELSLREYLEKEYDHLLETKGSFILNEDLEWKEERIVPIILSKKQYKDEYYQSDDVLAKMIYIRQRVEGPLSRKEIKKILKNRCITNNRLGTYFHKGCGLDCKEYPFYCFLDEIDDCAKPFIEIYYEQTNYKSEEGRVELSNCLAHEFFHFYHDLSAQREFNKSCRGRESSNKNEVIESLADFFALVYTISKGEKDYPRRIYNRWVERFGSNWPYAFAYCYYYNEHGDPVPYSDYISEYCMNINGCKEKFNEVFWTSKQSMKIAHDTLVEGTML